MTGLVIKSPWVDLILEGKKTWELRGSATKLRGRIALIKSKSGTIVGECGIHDCLGPFTIEQLRQTYERHQVPDGRLEQIAYGRTYAWVVGTARAFDPPIRYKHPSGAVIWVRLTPENCPEYGRLGLEESKS